MLAGSDRPLIPNSRPETVAELIFSSELPLFVSVTFWLLVWPTGTLLKLTDAREIFIDACVPVPLSLIPRRLLEASLVTVSVPVLSALALGAN